VSRPKSTVAKMAGFLGKCRGSERLPYIQITIFDDYTMYFLTLYPAVANFGTLVIRVPML